jgi:opacity protein-like surface antigen
MSFSRVGKIIVVGVITSSFGSHQAFAQANHPGNAVEKLYVFGGGGYGFSAAGESSPWPGDVTYTTYNTTPQTQSSTGTSKTLNLGRGFNIGIGGGMFLNKNIGVELGLGYLFGSTYSVSSTQIEPGRTITSKITMQGRMMRIVPAIRFQFGEKKLHPYMRAGLIVGVAGHIQQDFSFDGIEQTKIFTGRLSWGFLCGVGARYAISNRLDVFAELTEILQTWAPAKSVLTKATLNGADDLSWRNTSQKEISYTSNYSVNYVNGTSPPDSPASSLKVYWPFSSIGLTVGLHIKFFKNFITDTSKYNLN